MPHPLAPVGSFGLRVVFGVSIDIVGIAAAAVVGDELKAGDADAAPLAGALTVCYTSAPSG